MIGWMWENFEISLKENIDGFAGKHCRKCQYNNFMMEIKQRVENRHVIHSF